jgi:type II secretory pathway component PulF
MGNFFTLPDNFLATLTDYTSSIFDDLKPILLLLVGLFIGVFLVRMILEIISHRKIVDEEEEIYDEEL